MPIQLSHTKFVLVLLFSTSLSACSVLDLVNSLPSEPGSIFERQVAYGDHPRQRLDVYRPENPGIESTVIVYFYGGGWRDGNKERYEFIARKLSAMGNYVVVPDYRLYPEVIFPEFVNDSALATAYVLDHLVEMTGQPSRVFLMGHSAGAHVAALIALDERYLIQQNHSTKELSGFIGLAGPYDFLPLTSDQVRQVFPTDDAQKQSQPINFVSRNDPPTLLLHGDQDTRVWPRNSINLTRTMQEENVDVTLKIYPGINHAGILRPFIRFFDDDPGVLKDVDVFLSKHKP